MDIQINRARYLGADALPGGTTGGCTAAALGLAAALERGRRRGAANATAAQPAAKATPAPAKVSTPTFIGPNGRVKALAHAVRTDPKCKGKATAALALLCDDDLNSVTPAGMVKLLQRAPANLALPASLPRLANDKHGWSKIHNKLRERRGQ